jgi:hypothetical protein
MYNFSDPLIVTRNESLVEWLADKGIRGPVIPYATPDSVVHRNVFGTLPYWVAAFAQTVSEVHMPGLDRADRDRFNRGLLTVQEMDAAGAVINTFQVRRLHTERSLLDG